MQGNCKYYYLQQRQQQQQQQQTLVEREQQRRMERAQQQGAQRAARPAVGPPAVRTQPPASPLPSTTAGVRPPRQRGSWGVSTPLTSCFSRRRGLALSTRSPHARGGDHTRLAASV